jgi:hypothetical protein
MDRFAILTLYLMLNSAYSNSAVIIDFVESGGDVIATASGTIDTASFDGVASFPTPNSFVRGDSCHLAVGDPAGTAGVAFVSIDTGFTNNNDDLCSTSASGFSASSGSGDFIGLASVIRIEPGGLNDSGDFDLIYLPTGYISGDPISGTSTWVDTSLAGLQMIPGIYVYTWGSGVEADSLTITITAQASHEDFIVRLEEPVNGKAHSGIGNLRGWAISPDEINRVEIYIDGEYMYDAPFGGERLDVGEQYPEVVNSENSGFSLAFGYSNLGLVLDFPNRSTAAHWIKARAYNELGEYKESTSSFSIRTFHKDFIHKSERVDATHADFGVFGDEILIESIWVGEKCYVLNLKWRTEEQGFEIVELLDVSQAPAEFFEPCSP